MFAITDLPSNMQTKIRIEGECWQWTGAKNNRGYGSVTNGRGKSMLAHRRSYMETKGEIPAGLQLDHRCENKLCVNPAHLDAVTGKENMRRRFHGIDPKPKRSAIAGNFSDIFGEFFAGVAERYAAMTSEERAEDLEKRRALHRSIGCCDGSAVA